MVSQTKQSVNIFKCFSELLMLLWAMLLLAGCYISGNNSSTDVLSPGAVLANREQLLNHIITVRGLAGTDPRVLCTQMACSEDNPCCNICSASLQLCESGSCLTLSGTYAKINVGCSGNDCGLTCSPLQQGLMYQVTGIWKQLPYNQYALELQAFEIVF